MSPETNKAIIRQMFEQVWHRRRIDLIEEFYGEDAVQHVPGVPSNSGLAAVRKTTRLMLDACQDLHYEIEDEIAEGDKVVNRWTMQATLHGEMNGNSDGGKQVIVTGVTIFHLSQARVDAFWLLADNPGLLKQLGLIPQDGDQSSSTPLIG